ncbi:UDP-N-acetylglucosamine 2-epimerase [Terriglobus roseus DSM 18391]|uniref:UDP-N-acetylglucosamine 2-epimerase n=1 Tax=Terriglobus roseus (strain DSM 18391 / NRRL B-41598 / KBS 63) TaxID=926566 RepID=I3ZEA7_TERRK|nr:UDP-N-acetylglucosamine 2-epimerase (non-hydrolyzing) [Terriglobus roseus]AFL87575.1 UDP-N-acetylglucosamine 2-epimerase [Terriglobus roseus DSM 18391]
MKLLSIGGTRPQFVKMAVISKSIDAYLQLHPGSIEHRLLHTGQHRDAAMSDIFFHELNMPAPKLLDVSQAKSPGMQTGIMLAEIEAELQDWGPDAIIAYGDTNSTLASALAAAKLHIPIVHLEAGLRSFNRVMQEEINRIVTDHISDLLLCPTHTAMEQLAREGLAERAVFVGDVMLDAVECFGTQSLHSSTLNHLKILPQDYALLTIHRAETADDPSRLAGIFDALREVDIPIVFPMHPRLRKRLGEMGNAFVLLGDRVHIIEPVGYLEMLALQRNARFVMTDSGGVQKEAYFLGIPCLTLRNETEWQETLLGGWNRLVGWNPSCIRAGVNTLLNGDTATLESARDLAGFGDGNAGKHSVQEILTRLRCAS